MVIPVGRVAVGRSPARTADPPDLANKELAANRTTARTLFTSGLLLNRPRTLFHRLSAWGEGARSGRDVGPCGPTVRTVEKHTLALPLPFALAERRTDDGEE